jgi:hypothetical protein
LMTQKAHSMVGSSWLLTAIIGQNIMWSYAIQNSSQEKHGV